MKTEIEGLEFVENDTASNDPQQEVMQNFKTSILFGRLYKIVNFISAASLVIGLLIFVGGLIEEEPIFTLGLALIVLSIAGFLSAIFLRGYKTIIRASEFIIQELGTDNDLKKLYKQLSNTENQ